MSKDVSIGRGEPPKLGSAGAPPPGMGVADPKHAPLPYVSKWVFKKSMFFRFLKT